MIGRSSIPSCSSMLPRDPLSRRHIDIVWYATLSTALSAKFTHPTSPNRIGDGERTTYENTNTSRLAGRWSLYTFTTKRLDDALIQHDQHEPSEQTPDLTLWFQFFDFCFIGIGFWTNRILRDTARVLCALLLHINTHALSLFCCFIFAVCCHCVFVFPFSYIQPTVSVISRAWWVQKKDDGQISLNISGYYVKIQQRRRALSPLGYY